MQKIIEDYNSNRPSWRVIEDCAKEAVEKMNPTPHYNSIPNPTKRNRQTRLQKLRQDHDRPYVEEAINKAIDEIGFISILQRLLQMWLLLPESPIILGNSGWEKDSKWDLYTRIGIDLKELLNRCGENHHNTFTPEPSFTNYEFRVRCDDIEPIIRRLEADNAMLREMEEGTKIIVNGRTVNVGSHSQSYSYDDIVLLATGNPNSEQLLTVTYLLPNGKAGSMVPGQYIILLTGACFTCVHTNKS